VTPCSPEPLVPTYEAAPYYKPENHNLNLHPHETLKCHIGETMFSISVKDTAVRSLHTLPTSHMNNIRVGKASHLILVIVTALEFYEYLILFRVVA
jgi:hypothetical protein